MQPITEQRLIDAFHAQLGPAIREALDCPTVIEVMVNDCGRVRLDTIDKGRIETAYIMPPGSAEAIIRLVANHIGEAVSGDHPLIAGTIPITGERFQGVLPPLTQAPNFTIRKRPSTIFHLDDYVAGGLVSRRACRDDPPRRSPRAKTSSSAAARRAARPRCSTRCSPSPPWPRIGSS